jgi:hypothetical protein
LDVEVEVARRLEPSAPLALSECGLQGDPDTRLDSLDESDVTDEGRKDTKLQKEDTKELTNAITSTI